MGRQIGETRRGTRSEELQVEVYRFSGLGTWGSLKEAFRVLKMTTRSITEGDSEWANVFMLLFSEDGDGQSDRRVVLCKGTEGTHP